MMCSRSRKRRINGAQFRILYHLVSECDTRYGILTVRPRGGDRGGWCTGAALREGGLQSVEPAVGRGPVPFAPTRPRLQGVESMYKDAHSDREGWVGSVHDRLRCLCSPPFTACALVHTHTPCPPDARPHACRRRWDRLSPRTSRN